MRKECIAELMKKSSCEIKSKESWTLSQETKEFFSSRFADIDKYGIELNRDYHILNAIDSIYLEEKNTNNERVATMLRISRKRLMKAFEINKGLSSIG